MICAKCKSDCLKPGSHIYSAGKRYYLCAYCFEIFDKCAPILLDDFIKDSSMQTEKIKEKISKVTQNIIEARERRAKGTYRWLNKDKECKTQ